MNSEVNPTVLDKSYERSKESSTPIYTGTPEKRISLDSDLEIKSSPERSLFSLPGTRVTQKPKQFTSSSDSDCKGYKNKYYHTIDNEIRELLCADAPRSPKETSSEMDIDSSPEAVSEIVTVFAQIPETIIMLEEISELIYKSFKKMLNALNSNPSIFREESRQRISSYIPGLRPNVTSQNNRPTASHRTASGVTSMQYYMEQCMLERTKHVQYYIEQCMKGASLALLAKATLADKVRKEIYQMLCELITRGLLWDITKTVYEECINFRRASFEMLRVPKYHLYRLTAKSVTLQK